MRQNDRVCRRVFDVSDEFPRTPPPSPSHRSFTLQLRTDAKAEARGVDPLQSWSGGLAARMFTLSTHEITGRTNFSLGQYWSVPKVERLVQINDAPARLPNVASPNTNLIDAARILHSENDANA